MNYQGVAYQITKKFPNIYLIDLVPSSFWFSYGSNLCKADFEEKMKKRGSRLSLLNPIVFRLREWKRILSNESATRGLAYTIVPGNDTDFVDGIIHEIPERELEAFLSFEGVWNNQELLGTPKRRYDIMKIAIPGGNNVLLTLVGRQVVSNEQQRNQLIRTHKQKIDDYVRTVIRGAVDFGIDPGPFLNDLRWIEDLTNRTM